MKPKLEGTWEWKNPMENFFRETRWIGEKKFKQKKEEKGAF